MADQFSTPIALSLSYLPPYREAARRCHDQDGLQTPPRTDKAEEPIRRCRRFAPIVTTTYVCVCVFTSTLQRIREFTDEEHQWMECGLVAPPPTR